MVKKIDMRYPAAETIRTLHIYLPVDYETSEKRYPVMYMFDGHNLFFDEDATYGKSWGLKDYLDQRKAQLIVVGAECAHDDIEGFDRRTYEYLPLPIDDQAVNPFAGIGDFTIPGGLCGIGDETLRWLSEDVKDFVDQNFRTLPEREMTGIGGSSMGGLMSVYGILRYNKVYSRALCVSSAVSFCMNGIRKIMDEEPFDPKTRVYLTWGSKEAVGCEDAAMDISSFLGKDSREIASYVRANGGLAKTLCQVGGRHCEADWEKQLPLVMPFLWGDAQA